MTRYLAVLALALLPSAAFAAPRCDGPGVAAALAAAQRRCCPASNNGAYVSCAAHVSSYRATHGMLNPACKHVILRAGCAAETTSTTTPPTTTTSATTASTTTTTGAATTSTTSAATTSTTAAPTTTTTAGTTSSTTGTVPTTTSTTGTTPTTTSTTGTVPTTTSSTATTVTTSSTTSTTGATTTSTTAPVTTTTTIATTTSTTAPITTSTTATTTSSTTSTTGAACAPIVPGTSIANTYTLNGAVGEKRCTTNSASNRFGTCASDADCGGTTGACMTLPWVTADGQIMPFPTGVQTTFTVTPGTAPACEHSACVPCGNANASCPGIPGCEVAGNPNGCVPRATEGCCDQPGFVVPTFFVNILGGLCSRVDQIGCGTGVVNTSNPQTGDNEVVKMGDTSDPGPDCIYGTADDPAPKACTIAGEGDDYNGKILSTIGNGTPDAPGIHFRLTTPELSTTWTDSQSPAGSCANGSTYDDGELLVSQLILKAQPTSAGASGAFVDQNGDGCRRAGAGFIASTNPDTDGPITVQGAPAGPARPQSYDGSVGSVTAAVSIVFSGPNSPIRDIGFVAITPNQPAVVSTARACSCTLTAGCPE